MDKKEIVTIKKCGTTIEIALGSKMNNPDKFKIVPDIFPSKEVPYIKLDGVWYATNKTTIDEVKQFFSKVYSMEQFYERILELI